MKVIPGGSRSPQTRVPGTQTGVPRSPRQVLKGQVGF